MSDEKDDPSPDQLSKAYSFDFSGLPKENIYLKKLKRWLFRRGVMPDGDAAELLERMRPRFPDALESVRRNAPPPPVSTLLDCAMSEEEQAASETRRAEAAKKFREESWRTFGEILKEEAEAQWARIIDRRVRDNFYSVFIGLIVGYLAGKFL